MGKRKALNQKQIEWAWEKWCEGYTLSQIADALYVNLSTICRRMSELQDQGRCKPFNWRKSLVLEPLEDYPYEQQKTW